jgi:hypothetical protein
MRTTRRSKPFAVRRSFGAGAVLVASVAAQAPLAWSDATATSGLTAPVGTPYFGRGAAAEDFDGDGDIDLVTGDGSPGGMIRLFRNQGPAVFVDAGAVGLGADSDLKGLAAVDYDDDGDVDLALCRRALGFALYANDGTGFFTDVTAAAGLANGAFVAECYGCTWLDYDLDGRPDLYVSRRQPWGATSPIGAPNLLFRNLGGGAFAPVPGAAGAAGTHLSFLAEPADWDDDGDLDLLVADDFGGLYPGTGLGQVLWRNDGAAGFTDVTAAYGVTTPIAAMGAAFADLDRDGDLDYFLTNDPRGHVLGVNRLTTTGGFTDDAAAWGVRELGNVGWGCAFFDFDADGYEDLYVSQVAAPSRLFRNNAGVPPMVDQAAAVGLALTMPSNAPDVIAADFDGDGDLDLFETIAGATGRLMLNPGGGANGWFKVKAEGRTSGRSALGARVRVLAGGSWQRRTIRSRTGYLSSGPLETHFGLGAAPSVDQVEVRWPAGGWSSVAGAWAPDQLFRVVEPQLTGSTVWPQGSIQQLAYESEGDAGLFAATILALDPTPTPLGDGRTVATALDFVAQLSFLPGNPLIANNLGPLSAAGTRISFVYVPTHPALAGLALHAAAATFEPTAPGGVRTLSARFTAVIQ